MKKNEWGFTLVELIVVIVILAILAAILIPGLLKWIDEAKQKKYELEARNIYLATEASLAVGYVRGFEDDAGNAVDSNKTGHYTIQKDNDKCAEWLSYIEKMSGINSISWMRCYFDNGRLKAISIDYDSPTDGKYLKAWYTEIGYNGDGDSDYNKWKNDIGIAEGVWDIRPHD